MISDNADEAGDGYQFKSLNGILTISSDHNSIGTYGETIMTFTGHDTDASRSVEITGDLSSSTISRFELKWKVYLLPFLPSI